jgi:uncharacterized protein DUF4349
MSKRLVALIMLVLLAGVAVACRAKDKASTAESASSAADEDAARNKANEIVGPQAPAIDSAGGRGGGDGGGGGPAGASGANAGATTSGGERAAVDLAQAPDAGVPPLPEVIPGSNRVIKNINLEIRIDKGEFQRQFSRASTVAEQFQGFISGSQVSRTEEGELASGLLTIRVPSDRFEQAVARLKELGEVTGEDRSGQDVSREFVDLEARLKHAQTEEAFYLKLMGEAKSVADMIQVQSQLSGVQLRIEEIQGQLQYLKDQTSFSTITANIFEPGAELLGEPKPLAEAWREAVNGFQRVISGAVIGLGWIAPFALMGLIGFGIYRLSRRPKTKPVQEPEPSV